MNLHKLALHTLRLEGLLRCRLLSTAPTTVPAS